MTKNTEKAKIENDITRSTLVQFDWSSTDPVDVANAKLIVASVNHAGKLARALRNLEAELQLAFADVPAGVDAWMAIARQALAAYEAAQ